MILLPYLFSGQPPSERPICGSRRWKDVNEVVGNYFRREFWQAKPWCSACAKNGKRQPMSSVPGNQGKKNWSEEDRI